MGQPTPITRTHETHRHDGSSAGLSLSLIHIYLILVLAVPQSNAENTHIRLLSQLARKLVDEVFVSQLRELDQPAAVYALFNDIQL